MDTIEEKTKALKRAVGERARQLRKDAKFSSAEAAAEAAGLHPASIGQLERGENFLSPETLVVLSSVYNCDPAAFFPGSPITYDQAVQVIIQHSPSRVRAKQALLVDAQEKSLAPGAPAEASGTHASGKAPRR